MAGQLTLEAEVRDSSGTGGARRLRRLADKIPAVLYGADEPTQNLVIDYRRVDHAMKEEAFYSQIMTLQVGNSSQQVVLRELQRNPLSNRVLHLDFLRVREDRELQVSVPIHFENEEDCIGVKNSGGMITRILTEIEVSCLPRDLPGFFSIDLLNLDLGDSVHLSDLEMPEGVTPVALAYGEEQDLQIVNVQIPRGIIEDELEDEEGEELDELEATGEEGEGDESADEDSSEDEEES